MTAPTPPTVPTKPPRKKAGVPKTVWDLLFTLIIPIAILSPNILGSGISISEQVFGGGVTGNVRAYLLAALIPVVYVLADLAINRTVSGIALLGGVVALVRGALAFWYVDGGPLFALKDSVPSLLFGLLALGSLLTKTPIFRVVLDASTLTESPENRAATQRALHDPQVDGAVRSATVSYGLVELVSSVINYFVNLYLVVGKFGSDSFNAQVAQANAVMRIPGLVLSLIGVGVGIWLIQLAVKKRYGKEADIFSPEKLARLQEAAAE
ncbi:VC0807 family protein [Deinococcus alpinitundrae]|uniref:VC0807 family protein n=1 Tax=Deinococcus alpinitundrae TaxID=468913 RepID=UPI00137A2217|nr:VC0807 family protein [Deinococcus alpinitundrae]